MTKKTLEKYGSKKYKTFKKNTIGVTIFVATILLITAAFVPTVSSAVSEEEESQGCPLCAGMDQIDGTTGADEEPSGSECYQLLMSAANLAFDLIIDYIDDIDPLQFVYNLINNMAPVLNTIQNIISEAFQAVALIFEIYGDELLELMAIIQQHVIPMAFSIIGSTIDYIVAEYGSLMNFIFAIIFTSITIAEVLLPVMLGFVIIAYEIIAGIVCDFLANCEIPSGGGFVSITESTSVTSVSSEISSTSTGVAGATTEESAGLQSTLTEPSTQSTTDTTEPLGSLGR